MFYVDLNETFVFEESLSHELTMADFSQYATPAAEWLEFAKTWQPPVPPPSASVQEVRDIANKRTAQFHANELGRPGKPQVMITRDRPCMYQRSLMIYCDI